MPWGGIWECPDLVRPETAGESGWVLLLSLSDGLPGGGSGTLAIVGDFDGTSFHASAPPATTPSDALSNLRHEAPEQCTLRRFEKRLLDVLGYGLSDVDESLLTDLAGAEALRPRLRAALDQCLEGRSLRTRVVAKSLLGLSRSGR